MLLRPLLVTLALLPVAVLAADEKVTYNEHIRPILADNCFACHGADFAKHKAKRRLDNAAAATAERNGIRAIVPGKLEDSELWQRITSTDAEVQMPPEESHKAPLKPEQRELIKRWIQQGAVYQNHWAFEAIIRPQIPNVGGAGSPNRPELTGANRTGTQAGSESRPHLNPVDAFVEAKLVKQKLALSPEASPEILLRRVTLDLTGLPPTPEEVDAYLADRAPGAYERAVDRLLASPRYGEQFGRNWLDAVRYGDTHGLHLDNIRTIWPYRDWVVSAFNRNLPFDQFTIEQLAGDMLPNPRTDQLVASGYNRCHLTTSEGGTIEAEAEARNTADRANTTAAVWLGLTANCASCHDHKFDPLSQREYYSFGAFFKGLADRVWDGNVRLPGPIAVIAKDAAAQRRIDDVIKAMGPLEAKLTARADELEKTLPPLAAAMEVKEDADADAAPVVEKPKDTKAAKVTKVPGGGRAPKAKGAAKKLITYEVVWAEDDDTPTVENFGKPLPPGEWRSGEGVPVAGGKRALRLEGKTERPVIFTGGEVTLVVRAAAKLYVHFQPDAAKPPRAVSLEFITEEKTKRVIWGDASALGADAAKDAIVAGPLPAAGTYAKLEIDAEAVGLKTGKKYTGLKLTQSDGAGWWDHVGATYSSATTAEDPLLSSTAWSRSLREFARLSESTPLRHDIKYLVGLSNSQQSAEEKKRIVRYHRDYVYGPLRGPLEPEANAARKLLVEQVTAEITLPGSLISRELAVPKEAHILIRGQYDKPGDLVEAATPAFLPPLAKSGVRATRLDLARWIVDPKNPLTARVAVNRMWLELFGQGLVRTPADFGVQGDAPTHPELLDWLASEFVQSGWDVKKFVKLLVTSRTYRQESRVSPELLAIDPENKLLAHASRHRLDAEELRDQALMFGGILRPEIGGPPVRPYQPANIWEPVAYSGSNTKTYVQDHGDALYRRSIYSFWKRTAPAPSMTTFDAPSRESFCIGRGRSNTPLQALALMNDVQQFEAARAFAERLLLRMSSEPDRLAYAFRCTTARNATKEEQQILADTLATHRAHFAKNAEAASQVIANGESKPNATLPVAEFAAWTMVANLLMNLDETVNRN